MADQFNETTGHLPQSLHQQQIHVQKYQLSAVTKKSWRTRI